VLFANNLVLLHLLNSFQHALEWFSAACDQIRTKISTKKAEVLCLARNPSQGTLQVSGNTLQQVEKLKYVGVEFTSDERWNKETDTRIGKVNAVLRDLYRSLVKKM